MIYRNINGVGIQLSTLVEQKNLSDALMQDLSNFKLSLDMKNANTKFYKYGHVVPNIVANVGNTSLNTGQKAWFKFDDKNKTAIDAYRKLMRQTTEFFPHEEVGNLLGVVQELATKNDITMKHFKDYENNLGDKKRWVYLTNHEFEAQDNDKVNIGLCFRNGIAAKWALGCQIFTYRHICKNGAIFGKHDIAYARVIHLRSVEAMAEQFLTEIEKVFIDMNLVIKYYQAMPKIKFTQKQLDMLYKRHLVPVKYLPDWIEIEKKNDKKGIEETSLTLTEKDHTVWDVFNSVTEHATKNLNVGKKRISFDRFEKITQRLHTGIIQVVDRSL